MSSNANQNPAWRTIANLQKMELKELRKEYEKVFGKTTKSRNRKRLYSLLAKKLQESPGPQDPDKSRKSVLTAEFQRKRKKLERSKKSRSQSKNRRSNPLGADDPRLPKAGTTIKKVYKGKRFNVRVLKNGFEYSGKQYRSLSAIAKAVTGSSWNGYLFFGLTERSPEKS